MTNKIVPKIFEIIDIIQWYQRDELFLSPKYQRNSVWNEKAKSYLIDSIIRDAPIPPIFMRQTIDIEKRKSFKEIVDGQQRLTAIIEFYNNKFKISKSHNTDYGNKYFDDLATEDKEKFLHYNIITEIINEESDDVIYDMFARLNTNNYVLNRQEIRNTKYWGDFKVLAYNLSAENRMFFDKNKIFSDKHFSRMNDVEFVSSLINLSINGVVHDTQQNMDKLYQKYDDNFQNMDEIRFKFQYTMDIINDIYDYFNGNNKCFNNKTYLYTLYAVLYHQLFGLPNNSLDRYQKFNQENMKNNLNSLINKLVDFDNLFNNYQEDKSKLNETYTNMFERFVNLHKVRTTNKKERDERIKILNDYIN